MCNYHSQWYPVQRAFLDSRLEQIRMIANLLQTHQHIHHPS